MGLDCCAGKSQIFTRTVMHSFFRQAYLSNLDPVHLFEIDEGNVLRTQNTLQPQQIESAPQNVTLGGVNVRRLHFGFAGEKRLRAVIADPKVYSPIVRLPHIRHFIAIRLERASIVLVVAFVVTCPNNPSEPDSERSENVFLNPAREPSARIRRFFSYWLLFEQRRPIARAVRLLTRRGNQTWAIQGVGTRKRRSVSRNEAGQPIVTRSQM